MLQGLVPYYLVASYCYMGRITGRLGLAVVRLPFVLLHFPVAPLPWVGVFGSVFFRGRGQLPTPLGFCPWAWSSFSDSLGLDLEFWPGPFLSVVGILLPSVRLTTTPGLSSDLPGFPGGKSSSLYLMPLVIYALWICSSERKAHFELAKEYFLSGGTYPQSIGI